MPIPKEAQLVFKGKIFDVYQWEQEMFDGSKETFEMLRRANSVQILPIIGNKIMIAEEEQPNMPKRLGVIGGQQEQNETPLKAAKREMIEETGYTSKKWKLFKKRNLYQKMDWTISCFIAKNCTKTHEPQNDVGEKITPLMVSFDEFMDIIVTPEFRSKDITLDILTLHYQRKLEEFKKMLFS